MSLRPILNQRSMPTSIGGWLDDQAQLPLEEEPHKEKKHSSMKRLPTNRNLSDTLETLNKARKQIAAAVKRQGISLNEAISVREKAVAALQALTEGTLPKLEQERDSLVKHKDSVFQRRREDLRRFAEEVNWVVTRMERFDYVGCFKVSYKQERVTVDVGSEMHGRIDVVDGSELFQYLDQTRKDLDGINFNRELFFRTLKFAISLARIQGRDSDGGKVPVRILYPLVVLVRQSLDERFFKLPIQKSFIDYSTARFVYDIARFGQGSWSVGDERLRTQTPNMETIAKGESMTLPWLGRHEISATRIQIGALWIERRSGQ